MQTYIALFRGINVGGRNSIKMADLRSLLNDLGLENVNSYIQSGNVVFRSDEVNSSELSKKITAEIAAGYGFEPKVLIMAGSKYKLIMESNPFPEAVSDDRRLHIFFLTDNSDNPDIERIEDVKKDNEQYKLTDDAFYLYAPDGIGRSKLVSKLDKLLGVPTTGRNWRTIRRIWKMAESME